MTKDNFFTDFYNDGTGVWVFKKEIIVKKPSVTITSIFQNNGEPLKVGDTLRVIASINNVAYATLTISSISNIDEYKESKNGLENQPFVTFGDYILTDKNIGDVIIKVEAGNIHGSDKDDITVQVYDKETYDDEQVKYVSANNERTRIVKDFNETHMVAGYLPNSIRIYVLELLRILKENSSIEPEFDVESFERELEAKNFSNDLKRLVS